MSDARLVLDMPEDDYHAHPALSSTGARELLPPSCPAIFRWNRDNGRPDSRVFDIGHAAHMLALGAGKPIIAVPDELCASNGALSTAAAKTFVADARAAGQTPLKQADYDTVLGMRDTLTEQAGYLFKGDGKAEASIFWTDSATGVECRARLDWLPDLAPAAGRPIVCSDYKTSSTAEPWAFAREAAKYRYHMQGAWYRTAVAHLYGFLPPFVFVVQEKTPPYLVTPVQLDDEDIDLGHMLNARALEVFAECSEVGQWPGYTSDVALVNLPRWAYQ